jgi:hypothetical protein
VQVSNLKVGKLIDFGDDDATAPSSLVPPRGPAARGRHSETSDHVSAFGWHNPDIAN